MSTKGRISKKVEQKVKEYFAKIDDNTQQRIRSIKSDSDKPSTDK